MTIAEQPIGLRARVLYDQHLKAALEASHRNQFVAIEPDSGEHYLGRTMDEAINRARQAHPERISYVMRIGHLAAVEIGSSDP